jgi:hypothetical protein
VIEPDENESAHRKSSIDTPVALRAPSSSAARKKVVFDGFGALAETPLVPRTPDCVLRRKLVDRKDAC